MQSRSCPIEQRAAVGAVVLAAPCYAPGMALPVDAFARTAVYQETRNLLQWQCGPCAANQRAETAHREACAHYARASCTRCIAMAAMQSNTHRWRSYEKR